MQAIFRGRRHLVVSQTRTGVWLDPVARIPKAVASVHATPTDPDLILDPTDEDLHLAVAFERGEISAFEYPDGHTYPPDMEIRRLNRGNLLAFRNSDDPEKEDN